MNDMISDEQLYDQILDLLRNHPGSYLSSIVYQFNITEQKAKEIINAIILDGGLLE